MLVFVFISNGAELKKQKHEDDGTNEKKFTNKKFLFKFCSTEFHENIVNRKKKFQIRFNWRRVVLYFLWDVSRWSIRG